MKLPDYIACIAEYHGESDPTVTVLRSIAVVESRTGKLVVSRYYELTDYTDDEACDEIDSIVGDFKQQRKTVDVLYSNDPVPVVRNPGGGFVIKLITVPGYIEIIKTRQYR